MSLQEKVKTKLVESLNEDVYKVEHEGHPDADKIKELSHLKPGKKYINHITKYEKSAKDAAASLKKNGFQGVKIYKNWSVMEEAEVVDESNMTPSAVKVKIIKNNGKHELTIRQPNRKVTGWHQSFDSREDAEKFVHQKWGQGALMEEWDGQYGAHVMSDSQTVKKRAHRTDFDNAKLTIHHLDEYGNSTHIWNHKKQKWDENGKRSNFWGEETQKPTHVVHYVRDSDVQGHGSKMNVTAKNDADARNKLHQAISHEGSYKVKKVVALGEAKDPFAGTSWSSKKTKEQLLNDVKKRIGMDKPESKDPKSVVKDGKRVFESIELDERDRLGDGLDRASTIRNRTESLEEGRMSELHADIGDHMDKHIGEYKRAGGAEALMAHAAKVSHKIAKMHGMEHKHAEKFVSSYIDSKLNEEVELAEGRGSKVLAFKMLVKKMQRGVQGWDKSVDDGPHELVKRNTGYDDETIKKLAKGSETEKPFTHSPRGLQNKVLQREIKRRGLSEAYSVKKYSMSPKNTAKWLFLANKSDGSKVRNDGTLEFHEKDGNKIHVHSVWSEDGNKTSKYTVKTMSKSLYKKNYGNTMLEEVELEEGVELEESEELMKQHEKWYREQMKASYQRKSDEAWEMTHKEMPGFVTRLAARLRGTRLDKNGKAIRKPTK